MFARRACCRSVGMLQARSTVNGIFSDLGLEADSLNQLKVGGILDLATGRPTHTRLGFCGWWVLGTWIHLHQQGLPKAWHPSPGVAHV